MQYARLLHSGDMIGVCAPSSGVPERLAARLDKAIANVRALGYDIMETASVRRNVKCVSSDAKTRAAEFMALYENPSVAAIIPPWGGEFLMDMLPYLDFVKLSELPPKWVCGYSDITVLTFVLTTNCDIATIHGSSFMNMGYGRIHESDLVVFEAMSRREITQHNSERWGGFSGWDGSEEIYKLNNKTNWKSLCGAQKLHFEGRMIGGCLDVLCKLIGTPYVPITTFLNTYKNDGFIWTLESCEMTAADIYRSLWQMHACGWFQHCNGILYGRPDGYHDSSDFKLTDALRSGLNGLKIPIIYDADIGHIPPQIQIVNGAYGTVTYEAGNATVKQAHTR